MKDFFPGIFTSQSLSVDNDKASRGRAIQGLGQKSSYTKLETEIEPYMGEQNQTTLMDTLNLVC